MKEFAEDFISSPKVKVLPKTASRAVKNIEEFPMKAYYIQKEFLDTGKSASNFYGVILPVYDRERIICDCFKYRTKLDNEIFNKAVNAYASDEKRILHYIGIGASIVPLIKNTSTSFGIDFGVGDVIVPKQERRKIPTQLDDFTAPTINTYSIETTVAEKIDAILSLM